MSGGTIRTYALAVAIVLNTAVLLTFSIACIGLVREHNDWISWMVLALTAGPSVSTIILLYWPERK